MCIYQVAKNKLGYQAHTVTVCVGNLLQKESILYLSNYILVVFFKLRVWMTRQGLQALC